MATNPGKAFERDFIRSVPRDVYQYRLRDCGGWAAGSATRFTPTNDYDLFMYDAGCLYTLELKSTGNKRMEYDELTDVQEKGLLNAGRFRQLRAGVIVNFRLDDGVERCFYVSIFDWVAARKASKKKSFNVAEAEKLGVEINGARPKEGARYKWKLREFLNSMRCYDEQQV